MAYMTNSIALSMRNPETGRPLTANVYTLDGVTAPDGSPKQMSIGQLVMAICLNRAVEMEDRMVGMMAEMEVNTDNLAALTRAEELLQSGKSVTESLSESLVYYTYDETTGRSSSVTCNTIGEFLDKFVDESGESTIQRKDKDGKDLPAETIVTNIETKMDGLNTFSQQKMIELQSYTNKRDQAYDLVSNILKTINTVLQGNIRNL